MVISSLFRKEIRVVSCALVIIAATTFAQGEAVAIKPPRNVIPLDNLTSDPIVAEFLAKYNRLIIEQHFAAATSEALVLIAKQPDDKDAVIAGTCAVAFASIAAYEHAPASEQKKAAHAATERLNTSLSMIEKCPMEDRRQKYATLHDWSQVYLTIALSDAGSHTLALQTVGRFFSKDPDNIACGGAASMLCKSFREIPDKEGFLSYLNGLTKQYKGKPGAAWILWDLARIYDNTGDEVGFRSVAEAMEADFPDGNRYKQALRRLAAERKNRKK